jgi:hypothetical protein
MVPLKQLAGANWSELLAHFFKVSMRVFASHFFGIDPLSHDRVSPCRRLRAIMLPTCFGARATAVYTVISTGADETRPRCSSSQPFSQADPE